MTRRAIILAGGVGARLRPYTVVLPKPLMPIVEYPILEIVIRQLIYFGFKDITIAVNHQAELIKAFFGDGKKWGASITYSLEDIPLSTMGPLKLIPDLPENFIVLNGDVLTDLDFGDFLDQHIRGNRIFTISSHRRQETSEYGVLQTNRENILVGFQEKPVTDYLVSMGIYATHKSILDFIPERRPFGFDHLMLAMIEAKQHVYVREYDGLWLDIGRPDDYAQAVDVFEKNRAKLLKGK